MTWDMETDEDTEARRRSGAIDGRYQICHPVEGLIGVADTRAEAFRLGNDYANRKLPDGSPYCTTPNEIEVYDRMARRGQPRLWRRICRPCTYCHESGDYLSSGYDHGTHTAWSALWKCIKKRGLKPATTDLTSQLWVTP